MFYNVQQISTICGNIIKLGRHVSAHIVSGLLLRRKIETSAYLCVHSAAQGRHVPHSAPDSLLSVAAEYQSILCVHTASQVTCSSAHSARSTVDASAEASHTQNHRSAEEHAFSP
jgi:hypothetical protein